MAKANHSFLTDRGALHLYLVCRIDDYKTQMNERGGFSPEGQYTGNRGGYLWLTQGQAEAAARHVLQHGHSQGTQFGVFKLMSIVEEANTPIKVTAV